MRVGRSSKADAICNSPFVRALIKPLVTLVAAAPPLPPPTSFELISTQPSSSTTTPRKAGSNYGSMGQKRKRQAEDEGKVDEEQVTVSYNAENLPDELKKCTCNEK